MHNALNILLFWGKARGKMPQAFLVIGNWSSTLRGGSAILRSPPRRLADKLAFLKKKNGFPPEDCGNDRGGKSLRDFGNS